MPLQEIEQPLEDMEINQQRKQHEKVNRTRVSRKINTLNPAPDDLQAVQDNENTKTLSDGDNEESPMGTTVERMDYRTNKYIHDDIEAFDNIKMTTYVSESNDRTER